MAFLVSLAALVSATACGTVGNRNSDAENASASTAEATTPSAPSGGAASWGVEVTEPPRSKGDPTLVQQLTVFREKRTAQDDFDSIFPGGESDTVEGNELNGESRLCARRKVALIPMSALTRSPSS